MTAAAPARQRLLLFPVLLLLAWIGTADAASANQSGSGGTAVYQDAGRTLQTTITKDLWTVGPMAGQAQPPPGPDPDPEAAADSVAHDLVDCSDDTLLCAQSWGWTLAVPRAGLKRRTSYRKDGVTFRVHECLRGDGQRCQVALLSAVCGREIGNGRCARSVRPLRPGSRVEYVLYFFFNEDFGITAMGAGNRIASSAAARRAVATQQILIGDQGLLGPRW
jgi:hypothetical protein